MTDTPQPGSPEAVAAGLQMPGDGQRARQGRLRPGAGLVGQRRIDDTGGPAFPFEFSDGWMNSGMSLRAYAAIHLRQPNSGLDWLDAMIRDAQRDGLAGQALAGMSSISLDNGDMAMGWRDMAKAAYNGADAMLRARNAGRDGE